METWDDIRKKQKGRCGAFVPDSKHNRKKKDEEW